MINYHDYRMKELSDLEEAIGYLEVLVGWVKRLIPYAVQRQVASDFCATWIAKYVERNPTIN